MYQGGALEVGPDPAGSVWRLFLGCLFEAGPPERDPKWLRSVFFGTAKVASDFSFCRASEAVSDFSGAGAALSEASGAQAHPQAPWHKEERARFGETTKHVNLG